MKQQNVSYKNKKPRRLKVSHREGTELTLTMIKMYGEQSDRRDSKRRPFLTSGKNCGYCGRRHPLGKRNFPAAETRCSKCNKMLHFPTKCKSVLVNTVNQILETEHNFGPAFVGGVTTPTCANACEAEPAATPPLLGTTADGISGSRSKTKAC